MMENNQILEGAFSLRKLLITGDLEKVLINLNNNFITNNGQQIATNAKIPHDIKVFLNEFIYLIFFDKNRHRDVIRREIQLLASKLLKFQNLLNLCFIKIAKQINKTETFACSEGIKWNLLYLFSAFPMNFMSEQASCHMDKGQMLKTFQAAWLAMFKITYPQKMLRIIITHFIENVMDNLPNCELFADFLYKIFRQGNYMAVLTLAGIFKLIINRDFEYPNFYNDVYQIIQPNICYSHYSQKFFDLIDLIMTSRHIPIYICAAFVKKLSRILLFAPTHCQMPLIYLIRNLLCRHPAVHSILVHRNVLQTFDDDPYNEHEYDLQQCGAMSSSLWELKVIQSHWNNRIAIKAKFSEAQIQNDEMSLRWNDDAFQEICRKSYKRLSQESLRNDIDDEYASINELTDEELEIPCNKNAPINKINLTDLHLFNFGI